MAALVVGSPNPTPTVVVIDSAKGFPCWSAAVATFNLPLSRTLTRSQTEDKHRVFFRLFFLSTRTFVFLVFNGRLLGADL
jgi:hypothetical protein